MVYFDLVNNKTYGQDIIDCSYITDFPNLEARGIMQDFETVGSA
jgi:hypothetical protein